MKNSEDRQETQASGPPPLGSLGIAGLWETLPFAHQLLNPILEAKLGLDTPSSSTFCPVLQQSHHGVPLQREAQGLNGGLVKRENPSKGEFRLETMAFRRRPGRSQRDVLRVNIKFPKTVGRGQNPPLAFQSQKVDPPQTTEPAAGDLGEWEAL
ncbi:hypothetical protein Q8A67_023266 [Cirrhinus molitorella]|uniref:Uncharacterized protein n=1 Tax=Cirrhinus molitorella TaxID=172907 RepID=A0AA88P350_9TELE|nr:hypothetical protein Q8A67_023266 [Cirrhinus molitorella]